jgi:hypothetical protein
VTGGEECYGTRFTIPAVRVGIAQADGRRQRLALATVCNSAPDRRGADTLTYDLAGLDLDLVRTGRCPLLREHGWGLDCLLGTVVDAWLEGLELRALVRFAPDGEAERLWRLLEDGFPLSLSLGGLMTDVVPEGPSPFGGTAYRVARWRLNELSIVVHGQRAEAGVRPLATPETLGEIASRVLRAEDAARRTVRRELRLDRWDEWAAEAAPRLAAKLDVPADQLRDLLRYELAAAGEAMVRRLAVAVLPEAEAA